MKLLEYQAKKIFLDYGIRTPRGNLVDSVRKAREAVTRLGTVNLSPWIFWVQRLEVLRSDDFL